MKLVTTTSVFPIDHDPFDALEQIKKHGFDGADMALDYYCENPANRMTESDWKERLFRLREFSDRIGIPVTHAHAPTSTADSDDPHRFLLNSRSIEGAAILGARYIVLHPQHMDGDDIIQDEETFLRVNKAGLERYLPVAEKTGMILLSENLLWGSSADPSLIARFVREVNHPNFGWCWDTGHSNACRFTPDDVAKVCVPPLSLHLQDNHGKNDEHLIPGDGNIRWKNVFSVLKGLSYQGDFVLEAHHQSLDAKMPAERDEVLARLQATGRRMMETNFPE